MKGFLLIAPIVEVNKIPSSLTLNTCSGQTALYCAARKGHVDIVHYLLLDESIQVDPQVPQHLDTPLHGKLNHLVP